MRTPSVYVAEELMPYLRARIAEGLYRAGMRQSGIGEYLGITQAMVSKYLAGKYKRPPAEVAEKLDEIAGEAIRLILFGGKKEEAIALVSRRIFELFQTGFLCRFYSAYSGVSEETCRSMFSVQGNRAEVIEVLNLALGELAKIRGFPSLIPEVRSNLAYALPSPRGPEDVAAVPGRITAAKGRIFYLPPEFGASHFTAGILVELASIRPEIRSVLNIRHGGDVETALGRAGFKVCRVRTGGLEENEAVRVIAGALGERPCDAVIDEGGPGVEPLVYIFGESPMEVVEKVRRLIGALEE
ncbi:thiamine-phosphate synthase family protein [Thermococcus sp. MV11]|uniref:thiamine-phosphate synthase family protein n=1 Tax=Thermococcus sp. MV11 TaxID=1638267 RepID=UPI00142FB9B3|nr:thiamine-phosphate synthase family protein [Thermococcus sp. MV11]NJE03986.1 phosphomethylpyrimidine kinase [Thermococcus sp. MV11]